VVPEDHKLPRCFHASECGGCTLQHIPYADQLQQKQQEIESIFAPSPVLPIIPCDDPWRYRNKMEFSFSQNKAGDKFFGLILKNGRGKVFNLYECYLASTWFAETVKAVRSWWEASDLQAFHFHKATGHLRNLTLREGKRTGDRMVILTVSGNPVFSLRREHLTSLIAAIGDPKISIFLRIQQAIKGSPTQFFEMHLSGPDHITEQLLGLTFKISPTSFFQPNTLQAEKLYTAALNMAPPSDHVIDLYCGTATLGMIFARAAKTVTAIELNPYAVFDAKANAEFNGITNIEIVRADVGKFLTTYSLTPDLVILDPPRVGLDPLAIAQVLRLQPKNILYIACNPKTQAHNIQELSGYKIVQIQPVDQFPHTAHIENIVLLDRNPSIRAK
jgi:23S rRNA (uracil1939-C5)-methyltransferase